MELIETAGTGLAEEGRIAALTTFRRPLQEMGATAAEILLRKLAKGERPNAPDKRSLVESSTDPWAATRSFWTFLHR